MSRFTPAASAALLALAVLWLAMYLFGGAGSAPDMAVLSALYAGDRPALARAAIFVTELGGWRWLILVGAAFALALWLRGHRRRALLFVLIVLSGRLFVMAQKWLSARARPDEEHLVTVTSLSFPSGHSANSVVTYVAMALLVAPLLSSDWSRRALFVGAVLVCLAIGLSRNMLGVHWPSDVLGGWAFGLFWTFALLRLAGLHGTPRAGPSLMAQRRDDHEQRK